MFFVLNLVIISGFLVQDSEIESVSLYDSRPSFLWEQSTNIDGICIHDAKVFVQHRDNWRSSYVSISCLNAENGELIWRIDSLATEKYPVFSTIVSGVMLVSTLDLNSHVDSLSPWTDHRPHRFFDRLAAEDSQYYSYSIKAFDLSTGTELYSFPCGLLPSVAPMMVYKGKVLMLSPCRLSCYSLIDGDLEWRISLYDTHRQNSRIWVSDIYENYSGKFTIDRNIIFLGHNIEGVAESGEEPANLYAISAEDGSILWERLLPEEILAGPSVNADRLLVYSRLVLSGISIYNGQVCWELHYQELPWVNSPVFLPQRAIGNEYVPFVYLDSAMAVYFLDDGYRESVELVSINNGQTLGTLNLENPGGSLVPMNSGTSESNQYLLAKFDLNNQSCFGVVSTTDGEVLWWYYSEPGELVAGDGYICLLKRESFRVFR